MKINRPVVPTSNHFPGFLPLPGVLGRMARTVHFDGEGNEGGEGGSGGSGEITFTEAQQAKINEIRDAAVGKAGKKWDKDKADLERRIKELEEEKNSKPNPKPKDEDSIPKSEFEKLKKQIEDGANAKVNDLSTKLNALRSANLRADVITAAAKANAVDPDIIFSLVKDAVAYDDEDVPFIAGENGKPRYGANGNYLTIDAYITEFLSTKPYLVKSDKQPGGGSQNNVKGGKETPSTPLGRIAAGLAARKS